MSLKDLIKSVHSTPKDQGFVNPVGAITKFVLQRQTLHSHRRQDVWHPSELPDFCPRQQVLNTKLNIVTEGQDFDAGLLRIFDFGHSIHRWYQEELLGPAKCLIGNWVCSRCNHTCYGLMPEGSCSQCQWDAFDVNLTPERCQELCSKYHIDTDIHERDESKVDKLGGCNHCGIWGKWLYKEPVVEIELDGQNIQGRVDGILPVSPGSPTPGAVLDIKTINNYGFNALIDATAKHKKQMRIYMKALGMDLGCVLYVCKNDSKEKAFEVKPDKTEMAKILSDVNLVNKLLSDEDSDEIPPRECCNTRTDGKKKRCPEAIIDACFSRRG